MATATSLAVIRPEITAVLDSATGVDVPVAQVLGHDYERLMQLRMEVKTAIQAGEPRYLCAECFTPIYICRRKDTRRFFFRHSIEDGRCSAVTRGELSQDEIDARKYNGAKESQLHRQMKQWLIESLRASGRFCNVLEEKRWSGPVTGNWRKPDVTATTETGLKIAFEVQLSTTYLDVITRRRSFYLNEGALLFWVFARFDDDGRRLTMDDVFYNNNQNAFVVSQATRDASVAAGDFLLDCVWAQHASTKSAPVLFRGRVSFSELTLDVQRQQAFHYDYSGQRAQLAVDEAEERANWPHEFERWFLDIAGRHTSLYDQEDEVAEFPENTPIHWGDGDMFKETPLRFYGNEMFLPVAMLDAFYSVKHGKPVGLNRKQFIEVAHYLAESYPQYLLWFRRALQVYDRAPMLKAQDKRGNWARRVKTYMKDMRENPEKYDADQTHQLLFEFLFPELLPLPLGLDDGVFSSASPPPLPLVIQEGGR